MSVLDADAVNVGAEPDDHLTLVNVPVYPPVPLFTNKIKDLPATNVGMVNVQLPVIVTVCTVPLSSAIVVAVDELPIVTTLSV